MREPFERLFGQHFGTAPHSILEVAGDGSSRTYFRLVSDELETAIGAISPDHEENRAFLSFSRAFRGIGLPVPQIYGVDEAAGVWLEEDLGDTTLFSELSMQRAAAGGRFPDTMVPVYERVVSLLPRFQVEGGRAIDYGVAYPRAAFDRQSILWDLNYFKYHFLKLAHIPFNEERLETDFAHLADFLLMADVDHFLYRDFQSRNIMLRDGQPWFIDYQGGRRGALQYDIASLLYDAKAAIPQDVREHLLAHYLGALEGYLPVDRARFRENFTGYVLVRIMQAMGAYGYRGFFERKARFLQSVPYAARNIERLLEQGLPARLPELESVFRHIVEAYAHRPDASDPVPGLTVRLTSFSYKRGYPEDDGGHGGGFVFDCRALPNPGRHIEYSDRCGRDQDVIDYIERHDEAQQFFEHARALTDMQVGEYLRRSFSSLAVNFGCTGGQHRSVYMAERLARHLREHFPDVATLVHHREEPHWPPRRSELDPSEPAAVEQPAPAPAGEGTRPERVRARSAPTR